MAEVLVWRTEEDELVCPECMALHGKREGDGWSSRLPPGSGGPPPLHPNCRCWVAKEEQDA